LTSLPDIQFSGDLVRPTWPATNHHSKVEYVAHQSGRLTRSIVPKQVSRFVENRLYPEQKNHPVSYEPLTIFVGQTLMNDLSSFSNDIRAKNLTIVSGGGNCIISLGVKR
jgi:hypothetical protein